MLKLKPIFLSPTRIKPHISCISSRFCSSLNSHQRSLSQVLNFPTKIKNNNNNNATMNSSTYGSDAVSPNTTYVQADPSTFRAVVQKLTGAPDNPSAQKLPLSVSGPPSRLANPKAADMGPRRPPFKLHERRQAAKKLELNLTFSGGASFSSHFVRPPRGSGGGGGVLVSPVSTLEFLARGSPRTPATPCTEEEEEKEVEKRAIAEKGFYLHRSPLSTPRGSDPPELLPLFPLCSPTAKDHTHHINNSSSTTS